MIKQVFIKRFLISKEIIAAFVTKEGDGGTVSLECFDWPDKDEIQFGWTECRCGIW